MKLQIFSDLHADFATPRSITIAPDVDAVVVAGDTCQGAHNALRTVRSMVPDNVVVMYSCGNHEYYRRCLPDELSLARSLAPCLNIHVLENDAIVLGGVRFVGCTLWTDYELFGPVNRQAAMRAAGDGLNDHRLITWRKQPWLRFRPEEALLLHTNSKGFLSTTLSTPFDGPTVVVSHHAPHWRSVHPRYRSDLLTAAFVSDLSDLMTAYQPSLWIHGHVHSSFDYHVDDENKESTRVVCNPRGYGDENPQFDPALIVEVGS